METTREIAARATTERDIRVLRLITAARDLAASASLIVKDEQAIAASFADAGVSFPTAAEDLRDLLTCMFGDARLIREPKMPVGAKRRKILGLRWAR